MIVESPKGPYIFTQAAFNNQNDAADFAADLLRGAKITDIFQRDQFYWAEFDGGTIEIKRRKIFKPASSIKKILNWIKQRYEEYSHN